MANNMININIDIPADKKEIIAAFKGLINAFKNDIKVKEVENIADEIQSYEQFKTDYFSKYRGAFTGGETAKNLEMSSDNKNLSREERLEKYTNSILVALRDEELKEARFIKYKQ